jgi:hypothetical protein
MGYIRLRLKQKELSEIGYQLIRSRRHFLTGGTAEDGGKGEIFVTDTGILVVEFFVCL